jgi:ribonuclease P protein component
MKKGGFKSSSLFSLRILKNPLKSKGFSVVVSKKVAKTAVLRNKIRRRTYEVLQKIPKTPYSVILFAKNGVEKATFQEIEADISKLLKIL